MKEKLKNKVGVLMGGRGMEREVSFNSGRTICDHLDSSLYDVTPIFQTSNGELFLLPWFFLHRGKISDFEHRLINESKKIEWDDLRSLVDFVYLAMHGRFAEDGIVQGMLNVLSIPYLGSKVLGCALSMDRVMQEKFLRNTGINVPNGFVVLPNAQIPAYKIKFPLVVKPAGEGSSIGISIVGTESELKDAIAKAAHCDTRIVQPVLVEEKIEGMEFTAVQIEKSQFSTMFADSNVKEKDGWYLLPLTEVIIEEGAKFYDYEQKYMPGRGKKITPARCSEDEFNKIHDVCLKTNKLLGLETISRIDGFLTKDGRVVIIDVNPISGMTPTSFIFHQAAEVNINHTQLINYLIGLELEEKNMIIADKFAKHEDGMSKMRVAVLLGGESNEREISLDSGRNVCNKLLPQKYHVLPLFLDKQMRLFRLNQKLLTKNSTSDIVASLTPDLEVKWAELPKICDFVFIALHGGKGENGSVQGALEMLNLPYNGSGVLASALCMDKYKTNEFLKRMGFDVPISKLIEKSEWEKNLQNKDLNFPLIIKPHDDGCSTFVKKVKNIDEFTKYLAQFFTTEKTVAMVEEFIDAMELTVGVIGNNKAVALPPTKPVTSKDILSIQEKFLPGEGENQTPAPLPKPALELVMRTMEKVYEALGCKGYVRIDCFYQDASKSHTGKDRVIVLEVNSLPGLTPATCIFHQAAEIGLTATAFIDKIVELGVERFTSAQALSHQKELKVPYEASDQMMPQ